MSVVRRYYGCKRDAPDRTDRRKKYRSIPSGKDSIDLSKQYDVPVYDQLCLNSCTANALCSAYGLDREKRSRECSSQLHFNPSRLFLYYVTRHIEDNTETDIGVFSLRDAIKAMQRQGVCSEEEWNYVPDRFEEKPPEQCYISAKEKQVYTYERLDQDIDQLRACLKEECPFIFAFNIYKSFHSQENGQMPEPTYHEVARGPLGTHAVMAVGYNDIQKHVIVLNSWGKDWGDRGYFYMPYEFISDPNMSFDFWKVNFVSPSGVTLLLAFGIDKLIDALVLCRRDRKAAKNALVKRVIAWIDILDEEVRLRQGISKTEVIEDLLRENGPVKEGARPYRAGDVIEAARAAAMDTQLSQYIPEAAKPAVEIDGGEAKVPEIPAREQLRQHIYLLSADTANLVNWNVKHLGVIILMVFLIFIAIVIARN